MSEMLIVHISAGAIGVVSGFLALFTRKGAGLHRAAGNTFFITMATSAAAGAYIAFNKPVMITFLAGVYTFYLVATSWMTVMRKENANGLIDIGVLVAGLGVGAGGIVFGLEAQNSATGLKDGFSAEPYFFFGGLALFAVALDASAIIRRGIAGRQRIARHLWRMCFALYIGAGSLFTGPGAQIFPESLRGTPILSAPENLVLVLMFFWLVRVLFTGWYRQS